MGDFYCGILEYGINLTYLPGASGSDVRLMPC